MHRKFSSNRTSRSSLFLTELIISIFFLALTSVVCVRLYLYAHRLSTRSAALTHSVQATQEIAEEFISSNGDWTRLTVWSGSDKTPESRSASNLSKDSNNQAEDQPEDNPGSAELYYDDDWQRTAAADGAAWRIELTPLVKSGNLREIHLAVYAADDGANADPIYETDVEQYTGEAARPKAAKTGSSPFSRKEANSSSGV